MFPEGRFQGYGEDDPYTGMLFRLIMQQTVPPTPAPMALPPYYSSPYAASGGQESGAGGLNMSGIGSLMGGLGSLYGSGALAGMFGGGAAAAGGAAAGGSAAASAAPMLFGAF